MRYNLLIRVTADHVCEDEYYKCHRGPCLNKSLLCDGNIDCRGTWDDEDNCC